MSEKIFRDDNGNIVSKVVTATNEAGNVVEKHYDNNDVLYEEVEKFYNDKDQLVKLVKSFPNKNYETVFEYEYDENNEYKRKIQRDIIRIENTKIDEYENGKIKKSIRSENPTVNIKRVIEHDNNDENFDKVEMFCNGQEMYDSPFNNSYSYRFDELVKELSSGKVYIENLLKSNCVLELVESVINEDWESVKKYAEDLVYQAEEELEEE